MGVDYLMVLIVPVAVAAVVITSAAVRRAWSSRPRDHGPRPPAFALPVLANGSAIQRTDGVLALSDLRGHPVVLNFWAPWSDACAREAPLLEAAWQTCREAGVVVVGVDVQDLEDNAGAIVRRRGLTYPCVTASDDVYRAYDLSGVPVTYFIDSAGRVRTRMDGEISAVQLSEGIAQIVQS